MIERVISSPSREAIREPGQGGVKHKYMQHLLKELGEEALILGSIINAKDSQNPGQVYWQDPIIT